jgi:hypothetical protein
MNPVIPAPVPVPLPAPVWLLNFLLVLTFVLHLLAMNLLVGGATLIALPSWLGRRSAHHRELTHRAIRALPPVVAFTITLGVAPLLFLQLVYGQLFYTSSVLMAWVWLAVVLLLMLAYYGVYWFNMQHEELGYRGKWVIGGTTACLLLIMMIFVHNLSLLERPQEFYAQFLARGAGNYLGSYHLLTLVRFTHFFVASLAIAGLALAWLARTWRDESPELARWSSTYGTGWFVAGTGVQMVVGLGFLFSLPTEIRSMFLGGERWPTALLAGALVLALLSLLMASRSLPLSTVAIIGTISLMAVVRFLARAAALKPYFDPRALPVEGQWAVFALFIVLLLGGLATVGWMLTVFFRPATRPEVTG